MHQLNKKLFIFIFFILQSAFATEWKESPEIAALFKTFNAHGTMVVYDPSQDQLIGFNEERAKIQFIPASTFKIVNTLIGLSTGAVKNVDEILPYGGETQYMKEWETDMSLREAIKVSNLAIFKELARRIKLEPMKKAIQDLNYGNKELSNEVDRFWLDGSLRISAIEQTFFLAQLAQNTLPIDNEIQKQVHNIILIKKNDNWALYGKTGWSTAPNIGKGWWVGWVEKEGKIYSFALNMDINNRDELSKRIEIGEKGLIDLGILTNLDENITPPQIPIKN